MLSLILILIHTQLIWNFPKFSTSQFIIICLTNLLIIRFCSLNYQTVGLFLIHSAHFWLLLLIRWIFGIIIKVIKYVIRWASDFTWWAIYRLILIRLFAVVSFLLGWISHSTNCSILLFLRSAEINILIIIATIRLFLTELFIIGHSLWLNHSINLIMTRFIPFPRQLFSTNYMYLIIQSMLYFLIPGIIDSEIKFNPIFIKVIIQDYKYHGLVRDYDPVISYFIIISRNYIYL